MNPSGAGPAFEALPDTARERYTLERRFHRVLPVGIERSGGALAVIGDAHAARTP